MRAWMCCSLFSFGFNYVLNARMLTQVRFTTKVFHPNGEIFSGLHFSHYCSWSFLSSRTLYRNIFASLALITHLNSQNLTSLFFQYIRMALCVSTSFRINGVHHTQWAQFWPQFNHCSPIQIVGAQQIPKQQSYICRIVKRTIGKSDV